MKQRWRWLAPQALTLGNLSCGLLASVLIVTDPQLSYAVWAALLVWTGALLDAFDGPLARKLGVSSRFGVAFDSVADFFSFGVAPGVTAAMILRMLTEPHLAHGLVWSVCGFYIFATAARLARYSHQHLRPTGRSTPASPPRKSTLGDRDFTGLPSPAAGLLLVTMAALASIGKGELADIALLGVAGVLGVLMVSHVRYRRAPSAWRAIRPRWLKGIIVPAVLVGGVLNVGVTIASVLACYVLLGWKSRRAIRREEANEALHYPWPTP